MTTFVEKILALEEHLSDAGIDHAFGGAICLGYHVESPRATVDIDVNVLTARRPRTVLRALPDPVAFTAADLVQIQRDGQVRLFWDRTPIDLFFPQHALHAELPLRVERVPFAEGTLPILSATDLTVFKALFDRPKDWVDIADMFAYGGVETEAARQWLVRLLGPGDARVTHFDALV